MKTSRFVLAIGGSLILAACGTNWDVDAVRGMPSKGNAFQQALHQEYTDLAAMERDEADWTDTSYFNDRATDAANGVAFGPQQLANRNIPADKVADMQSARFNLISALPEGAKSMPWAAARAQAMYDCWMQEQEENFQPEDIAKCKGEFEIALAKLTPKPMAKKAPPKKKKMMMPTFTVYFDFNEANPGASSQGTLADIAATHKKHPNRMVILKGHTDRAGSDMYNQKLSDSRTMAVSKALQAAGVAASKIHTEGHGETAPAIKTNDGLRKAGNRRVEVRFGG